MSKYRKKPVVVEAVRWTGENYDEIAEFMKGSDRLFGRVGSRLIIITLEGPHVATMGDYIIKGVKGEFYPCNPEIFAKTYEEVCDEG